MLTILRVDRGAAQSVEVDMTLSASPLCGEVVDAVTALSAMRRTLVSLRNAKVLVISAYLKVRALDALLGQLHPSNQVCILVRWQPNDLIVGASDLESYALAREKGWHFCARQDLHAKVYAVGSDAIFIGSANLTSNGFSLHGEGNAELMVKVPATTENLAQINSLFDGAVVLEDEIVARIKAWLDTQQPTSTQAVGPVWPEQLLPNMTPVLPSMHLMISECFFSDGRAAQTNLVHPIPDELSHDFSLLALTYSHCDSIDPGVLVARLMQSKMFRWLRSKLDEEGTRELYYGRASALLHDALIDDHRPQRHEVKGLLSNLLGWIAQSPACGLVVDRPNHSQRISLLANSDVKHVTLRA